MKLIDKDALVAEIEKLIDKGRYHEEYDCAYRDGNNSALYALKGKLNTLEVKEVNPTDTFIEKARKWFEKQNEWRDINGIKHCDMESFEDFKKYMEE